MPNKNKITLNTIWGKVTRTTARNYTHVVMRLGYKESYIIAQHEQSVAYTRAELRKHEMMLSGERPRRYATTTDADLRRWIAADRERLASYPEQLEKWLQENKEIIRKKIGHELGFCGRLDLAEKLYKQHAEISHHIAIFCLVTGRRVR